MSMRPTISGQKMPKFAAETLRIGSNATTAANKGTSANVISRNGYLFLKTHGTDPRKKQRV